MIHLQLRGIDFIVHDDEALSNAIKKSGDFWEADILDYLRDNFNQHKTIVDIGANIGNHSVYFVNFLKYSAIIAIEPVEENYNLLEKNMEPYENYGLVEAAAGSRTGYAKMHVNRENMGASEISQEGETEVAILALDRVGLSDVTLMKIDAERYEPEVLEGAQDTIYRCKPLILIEDAEKRYHALLPEGYELLKEWEHHKTYLYGWFG